MILVIYVIQALAKIDIDVREECDSRYSRVCTIVIIFWFFLLLLPPTFTIQELRLVWCYTRKREWVRKTDREINKYFSTTTLTQKKLPWKSLTEKSKLALWAVLKSLIHLPWNSVFLPEVWWNNGTCMRTEDICTICVTPDPASLLPAFMHIIHDALWAQKYGRPMSLVTSESIQG